MYLKSHLSLECKDTKKPIPKLKGFDPELVSLVENDILRKDVSVKWEDIAGLSNAKENIKQTLAIPLWRPDLFKGLRRPSHGILLVGPAGTGKTLVAKAIASDVNATFFDLKACRINSKCYGESEKLVRITFELARHYAPSVIFIEEVESLCSSRGRNEEHGASSRVITELLCQIDGVATDSCYNVTVIASTNFPWDLDGAVLRKLEKRIYIPMPNVNDRIELLKRNLDTVKVSSDIDIDDIGSRLEGYSAADVIHICRDACMWSIRENTLGLTKEEIINIPISEVIKPVTNYDFNRSIQNIKPSVRTELLPQYEDWIKQYGVS